MHYSDTWMQPIPKNKILAYSWILGDEIIQNLSVVYVKAEQKTIVEYDSELLHDYIKNLLKERAKVIECQGREATAG